jgi:hypothetical protein
MNTLVLPDEAFLVAAALFDLFVKVSMFVRSKRMSYNISRFVEGITEAGLLDFVAIGDCRMYITCFSRKCVEVTEKMNMRAPTW